MRTLITGGTVARANGVFDADVLVDEGRILEVGERLHKTSAARSVDEIIDVRGCIVMPGGVDVHTHVNLTVGDTQVSDGFAGGTEAAVWGGTTTIVEHPGFGPQGCDLLRQIDRYTEEADGQCAVDYAFHGVFQHVDADILAQIPEMVRRGIPTIKAYTTYDGRLHDEAMLAVLAELEKAGGLLTVHAENHAMTHFLAARLEEMKADPASHPKSRPAACEAEAVYRMLRLACVAEASIYIVHLSTAAGLEHIRQAQRTNKAGTVIAETCPQYLLLNDSCYAEPDGLKYVMAPPLRTNADREALWDGLADGSIAVVATDHCSFSLAQKRERGTENVFQCPGGIPGVETRIPLLFSEGVLKGRLTLPRFVDVVSTAPARIMGLSGTDTSLECGTTCFKGRLEPGADADITVLDPSDERLIKANTLHQKTDSTPYEGMVVRGWPRHVWLRGEAVLRDRHYCGHAGQGRCIMRAGR